MRIICDYCERQITGNVKVLAGSLNLHPDCFTQLAKEPNRKSTSGLWQHQDDSVGLLESRGHQAFDLINQ